MSGVESQRAVVAMFMAVIFAFLSFVLVVVDWAAATGRLRRNQWVGIRIPSTMRSDQGWVAGHRAALRLMPMHLLVGVGLLVAVLFMPTLEAVHLVGVAGAAVFLAVAAITGVVAHRAAKTAGRDSGG